MSPSSTRDRIDECVIEWFEGHRQKNGTVNTNVMTVPIILFERMMDGHIPLVEDDFLAKSQVKGLSGPAISKILKRHGIDRRFTSEGGRTSRGTTQLAIELAAILNRSEFVDEFRAMDAESREVLLTELQFAAVSRLKSEYFDRKRLEVDLVPSHSTVDLVRKILDTAKKAGGATGGAVAQHLVGASLAITFPAESIPNHSYSTADQQTERAGDFVIGTSAIHVTVAPSEKLMSDRCKSNLQINVTPIVLVPEDRKDAAVQMAENAGILDRVRVSAIEEFVGSQIDLLAAFDSARRNQRVFQLIRTYNKRVSDVEPDSSFQITIPPSFAP